MRVGVREWVRVGVRERVRVGVREWVRVGVRERVRVGVRVGLRDRASSQGLRSGFGEEFWRWVGEGSVSGRRTARATRARHARRGPG